RRPRARAASSAHRRRHFHAVQHSIQLHVRLRSALPFAAKTVIYDANHHWRNAMAMSMTDKATARSDRTEWPKALQQEFEREAQNHNGCVGSEFVSESDRVRVWTIRLKPG